MMTKYYEVHIISKVWYGPYLHMYNVAANSLEEAINLVKVEAYASCPFEVKDDDIEVHIAKLTRIDW